MEILEKKAPFVSALLKGVGQIMLQNNAWTGLLFLVGIFYDDNTMGVAAIVAAATGTMTARLLKYDEKEIQSGLYGFSACLVGVALTFLFNAEPPVWAAILVGSGIAAILQHFFIVRKIPVFTLPFILTTWVLVFCLHRFSTIPHATLLMDAEFFSKEFTDFTSSTNGFGEVIFQGSFLAGLIFMIAVFIGNPVAALYGLAGSILGAWVALLFAEPVREIHMGMFSFNAVLCSIVFAGTKRKDGVLVVIAAVFAVLIDVYMLKSDWHILTQAGGVLTFPFVLATWLTLPIKKFFYRFSQE